jgi:hydroxymethylpyrimidine pyrophosphatase-like HAD family hydrolase
VTRPELVVLDIDGTILGRDHRRASDRVADAIHATVAKGVPVALCSGRPLTSIAKIAATLDLPGPHVAFDGALVGTPGATPIYRLPLTHAAARGLVVAARAIDLVVELYLPEAHYVDAINEESVVHGQVIDVPPTAWSLDEVLASSQEGDVVKGQVIGIGDEGRAKIRSVEAQGLPLRFGWAKPPPGVGDRDYVNVTNPGVSKGVAVRELAAALGVPLERVMGVGDGPNDAPLLEVSGLAVAMGNAEEPLKRIADVVVPSVHEDGLAVALERYVLS